MKTWLICGGRDFDNQDLFDKSMETLVKTIGKPDRIVTGSVRGADGMAKAWAEKNKVAVLIEFAQWRKFGKPAGPMRNQKMLDEQKPDIVIAFPGGAGTADMVSRAKTARVQIVVVAPNGAMECAVGVA